MNREPGAGELLPHTRVRRASDGLEVDVRRGRGPLVLFSAHAMGCAGCRAYLRDLLAREEDWSVWGARVYGIVTEEPGEFSGANEQIDKLLIDEKHVLAEGSARMVVADEWGEIFWTAAAGDGHALPSVDEVLEWVRFVAIQCPECEGPEGEWRQAP